jgi:hypothetical protein
LKNFLYCETGVVEWIQTRAAQDTSSQGWRADTEISTSVKTVIEYSRSWKAVIKCSGSLTKTETVLSKTVGDLTAISKTVGEFRLWYCKQWECSTESLIKFVFENYCVGNELRMVDSVCCYFPFCVAYKWTMFRVRLSTDRVCGTCVNINVNCTVVVVETEYLKTRYWKGEGDNVGAIQWIGSRGWKVKCA